MTFVMLSVFSSGIQLKLEILALLTMNVACYYEAFDKPFQMMCSTKYFPGVKKKSGNDTFTSMLCSPARQEWNKGTPGEASVVSVSEKLPAKQSDL